MKKNKKMMEYVSKYGDIPSNYFDRFIYLISKLNLSLKDIDKIKESIRRIRNIQYEEKSFAFFFFPEATPRPRYSRFTKCFYVKTHLDYNALFNEFMEACDEIKSMIVTPCELYVTTFSPIPSDMNKIDSVVAELGLIKHIVKPDADNFIKTYSDMIQQNLVLNDAICYRMHLDKLYSFKPRIEITVRYMTEYDSVYNKRKISRYKGFVKPDTEE